MQKQGVSNNFFKLHNKIAICWPFSVLFFSTNANTCHLPMTWLIWSCPMANIPLSFPLDHYAFAVLSCIDGQTKLRCQLEPEKGRQNVEIFLVWDKWAVRLHHWPTYCSSWVKVCCGWWWIIVRGEIDLYHRRQIWSRRHTTDVESPKVTLR